MRWLGTGELSNPETVLITLGKHCAAAPSYAPFCVYKKTTPTAHLMSKDFGVLFLVQAPWLKFKDIKYQ